MSATENSISKDTLVVAVIALKKCFEEEQSITARLRLKLAINDIYGYATRNGIALTRPNGEQV